LNPSPFHTLVSIPFSSSDTFLHFYMKDGLRFLEIEEDMNQVENKKGEEREKTFQAIQTRISQLRESFNEASFYLNNYHKQKSMSV